MLFAGLGYSGQVVTVAGGYFRNMLYPRGLAKYASRADIALTEEVLCTIREAGAAVGGWGPG